MTHFETVVDEYDRGRPAYPDALYDALGQLAGRDVVEIGAGTGIATRQLVARGARVVALDAGPAILAQAKRRTPELAAAVGDGARLPLADACADLVCVAQAWHWLDPTTRTAEARRILRAGGCLAAWWSHPVVAGTAWLGDYWDVIETTCAGTHRAQAETDWGPTLAAGGHLDLVEARAFEWMREVSVDDWITDQASHSYVATLTDPARRRLLGELEAVVRRAFPDAPMRVPFVTRLWVAARG